MADTMASSAGCKYHKRPGTGGLHGQKYEIKMVCLMFLRGLNWGRFHLATNLNGAGAFDDIVLQLHGDNRPSKTLFIQLKHKLHDKIQSRKAFVSVSPKNDFSLLKYFLSYRNDIQAQFQAGTSHQIFRGPLESCNLVLYTNAKIHGQLKVSDHQDEILSSSPDGLTSFFHKDRDEDVFSLAQHIELYQKFLLQNVENASKCIFDETTKFVIDYKARSIYNASILKMANELKNNPVKQQVLDNIKILSKLGSLSEYDTFLQKLMICTQQATESELDIVIKDELSKYLRVHLKHSTVLLHNLLDKIQAWWISEQGTYLTEESLLWDETVHEASQLLNEMTLREIQTLGIVFSSKETKQLRKRIGDARVVVCLTGSTCMALNTYKIVQALEQEHIQFALGLTEDALHFWLGRWCHILVVECHKDNHPQFSKLSIILEHHPEKKLIMIVQESDSQTIEAVKCLVQDGAEEVIDSVSLASLDEATQKQVLMTEVNFQGYMIPLWNLINNNKMLKDAITSEMIFMILKGGTVRLGASLKAGISYYIPRTLQRADLIQPDFLQELISNDGQVFAISGISEQNLQEFVPAGEKVCLFDGYFEPGCRFYVVENKMDMASLQDQVDSFVYLCKRNGSFEVLAMKGKVDISRFINTAKTRALVPDSVWDLSERVVVVAGEPGMGKSTLITHMALRTKGQRPDMWVVCVDLNNMTSYLDKFKEEDTVEEQAINFLLVAADITEPFEVYFFKHSVNTVGNLVVLFDGFDEICPDYKVQVIKMFQTLLKTSIAKIWITSRLNRKDMLEQSLCLIAFAMKEFSVDDQRRFLDTVWSRRNPGVNRNYLETFITDVLRLVVDTLRDADRSFMGIPLQTMLVAEAFEQQLKDGQNAQLLQRDFDVVELYERFFYKKCEIYFTQKRGDNITNISIKSDMVKKQRDIEQKHILVALMSYMSPKDLEELHDKCIFERASNYLREETNEWSTIGILHLVVDGKPQFLHKTIMEFFIGKWLTNNYFHNIQFVREKLFHEDYFVIRHMFDTMLVKGFPLHIAVLNNDILYVKQTLTEQNVNCTDIGGRTLLHLAILATKFYADFDELLQYLLDHGANIHLKDSVLQWSPVQYADHTGNWEALGRILQGRQYIPEMIFVKEHMISALLIACTHGYVELLEFLIQAGVDVNAKLHAYKRRALHVATTHGHVRVLKCLLQAGADINAEGGYGKTALHMIAERGDVVMAECLITAGANVNAVEWTNSTALHISAKNGHTALVELLLQAGADCKIKDQFGCLPLDVANISGHQHIMNCLEGMNMSSSLSCGPLHKAVRRGDLNEVKLLLEYGSPVDVLDMANKTPLHVSAQMGYLDIANLLVEMGSDVNACCKKKKTPLHYAVIYHHLNIVQLLIEKGSMVDAMDKDGTTPLHYASIHKCDDTACFLIGSGSRVDAVDKDAMTALHWAALQGDLYIALLLIKKGIAVDSPNKFKMTPLHYAALQGHLDITELLIEKGSRLDVYDKDCMTPLHWSVLKGHLNIVYLLISKGCSMNSSNEYNTTPLHIAAREGHFGIMFLSIEKGFMLDAYDKYNMTPLHYAASKGNLDITRLLIKHNSKVNIVENNERTPLHCVAMQGDVDVARFLIESGGIVDALDSNDLAPLHYAAMEGHTNIVRLLLDSGSPVNARDKNYMTPLHYAARDGHLNVTMLLIVYGCSANVQDKNSMTPLYYASVHGHMNIIFLLIKQSSIVNARDKDSMTPLHHAVRDGTVESICLLIEKGSSVNALDKNRVTPLHLAALHRRTIIVKLLIQKGSVLNILDKDSRTPLHCAVQNHHLDMVQFLIKKGCIVDAIDKDKRTALHCAVINGHLDMVRFLIKNGSSVNRVDVDSMTPLHYAVRFGHWDVVHLLQGDHQVTKL